MQQRVIEVHGQGSPIKVHEFGHGNPRTCLIAGVHGGEGTSIRVANQLVYELARVEATLTGSVAIVPVSHPAAFMELQRDSPLDSLNLNRVFPGAACGKPTEALAQALWREIRVSDLFIDLHCVWTNAVTHVYAPWSRFEHAEKLAATFAFDVVADSYVQGGMAYIEANKSGIGGVVIEFPGHGSRGRVDEQAADYGTKAVLLALFRNGILSRPPEVSQAMLDKKPAFVHQPVTYKFPAGYFRPEVTPGTWLAPGQLIGTIDGQAVLSPLKALLISLPPAMYFPKDQFFGYSLGVER